MIMATLRIKQLVKEKGMTMAEVAKKLGVNPVNLSSAIKGNPTLSTLSKIAEVLEVEVANLFEWEEKAIYGFVKIGGEVIELSSFDDIEKALIKAKELK